MIREAVHFSYDGYYLIVGKRGKVNGGEGKGWPEVDGGFRAID